MRAKAIPMGPQVVGTVDLREVQHHIGIDRDEGESAVMDHILLLFLEQFFGRFLVRLGINLLFLFEHEPSPCGVVADCAG
jgi:hypothetical protein